MSILATFMDIFLSNEFICFVISLSLNYLNKTYIQPWKHSAKLQEIISYFTKFVILGTFSLFNARLAGRSDKILKYLVGKWLVTWCRKRVFCVMSKNIMWLATNLWTSLTSLCNPHTYLLKSITKWNLPKKNNIPLHRERGGRRGESSHSHYLHCR